MDMCYVEWWNEALSKWELSLVPLDVAFYAVVTNPAKYHIIDESAIEFY